MKGYYNNLFSLVGKTAIVTGGAGILGERFCRSLADFGANVAVVDIKYDEANDLAKVLEKEYQVKAVGIECNITEVESINKMISQVINMFGEVNILHNNAAGKSNNYDEFFAPYESYSLEQWQAIMDVNLNGMFLVSQAVGKRMVEQGKGGAIIQTSSIYGILGPDQRIYEGSNYLGRAINTPAVYSASKAAVVGLTKYLATYWADKNIRVNTITPGGNESGQNQIFKQKYSQRIPLGRMGQPDEMTGALIFLASNASSYITGQNIIIDGGLSAW